MPVPSAITDLSTTAASNSPAGSEAPTTADDYLRAHASFIAQLNANKLDKAGTVTATANQPMGGYRHTGAGTATAAGEYVIWNQTGVKFPAIGIGTASSSWSGTSVYAIDIGPRGAVYSDTTGFNLAANTYYDGTNYRAKETAPGALVNVADGVVVMYTIASATAGAVQTLTERVRLDANGNFIKYVATSAPTLSANQQMVFALTSNTNLRISVRGTDGTTRVANITLA